MTRHMIDLSMFSGLDLGIILPRSTGIIYSNQAEGGACIHPELEGAFVPFGFFPERETEPSHKPLYDYFVNRHGNRGCITSEAAQFIDDFLAPTELPFTATVDRDRLSDSVEAWVWLRFGPPKTEHLSLYTTFESLDTAVLVWPNSD